MPCVCASAYMLISSTAESDSVRRCPGPAHPRTSSPPQPSPDTPHPPSPPPLDSRWNRGPRSGRRHTLGRPRGTGERRAPAVGERSTGKGLRSLKTPSVGHGGRGPSPGERSGTVREGRDGAASAGRPQHASSAGLARSARALTGDKSRAFAAAVKHRSSSSRVLRPL